MDTLVMNFRSFSALSLVTIWADVKYGDETSGYRLVVLRTLKSVFEERGVPVNAVNVDLSNDRGFTSALNELVTLSEFLRNQGDDPYFAVMAYREHLYDCDPDLCSSCLVDLAFGEISLDDLLSGVRHENVSNHLN